MKEKEATKVDLVSEDSKDHKDGEGKSEENSGFLSSIIGNVEGLFKDPDFKN